MKRDYARLTRPLVREDGVLTPVGWDEAMAAAAEGLSRYHGESFGMNRDDIGMHDLAHGYFVHALPPWTIERRR